MPHSVSNERMVLFTKKLSGAPMMAKVLVFFPRELITLRKVPSKRPMATPPKTYLSLSLT